MKKLYACFILVLLLINLAALSATNSFFQPTGGSKVTILSEDFEGAALPSGWTNDYGLATYGWQFGTDLSSAYWNIPPHTTYACANDDSCNCDMSNVNLTTPSFNNSLAGAILEFDYLSYTASDVTEVQISIDGGITFITIETLPETNGIWVDDYAIDISSYLSANAMIRFHYSDAGSWSWGFCIDNVEISSPGGDDLAATGISPHMAFVGDVIYPEVSIRNTGSVVASSYSVNLKINFNATEVYNENMTFIAQPLQPATDKTIVFNIPFTVAAAGNYEMKATVIMANDINPANDTTSATLFAASVPPYNHFAYAVNIDNKSFNAVDLTTGVLDSIAFFDVMDFPMSFEFIDNLLYVFRISGKVDIVYSDGTLMTVGAISGMPSSPMAATYCELNDKTYIIGFNDTVSILYELDINTLQASQIGVCGSGVFIALEATQVGALYGVTINDDQLYSIDRFTGTSTLIGSTGLALSYGQDISWDSNTGTLYGMLYDETAGGVFGTFDTSNGLFTSISVAGDQIAAFAVNSAWTSIAESDYKKPSFYPNPADDIINMNLTENSMVTIYDLSGRIVLQNNVDPTAHLDISSFCPGAYIISVSTETTKSDEMLIVQ
ncbi:MAG: hypothetical protein A2W93_14790 [Bacteroidetes bacterium GWF2_43_63]|nr:MAG: hypothetical protein A2W94_01360 [Bacteroidetes bacterium GWE2_42_42]OFY52605.1 MAG: hypothetical protein A2W93_14790 [Bacteroidetes bacterium GWF2_43_63]